MASIKWNPNLKLIAADVDETVADNYTPAEAEMIVELINLLEEGKIIFFVTGASLARVRMRIVDHIPSHLRKQILVSHCSGAEVWGFKTNGDLQDTAVYSLYDNALTEEQKKNWREVIQLLIAEFKLRPHDPSPDKEFKQKYGNDPHEIMLEDRGPQITLEMINGYDMSPEIASALEKELPQTHGNSDFRVSIMERADQLLAEKDVPVTPRVGGMWAIDFALKGVSKTTSVKHVVDDEAVLKSVGLTKADIAHPEQIEIWGDRFSATKGTDRHMCEALDPDVRAIDFRQEDPSEFPPQFNIVVWDGEKHLHNGLLEYLKSRNI